MVNQRKQYPTFFTQFKSRILTIKIERIFLEETIFLCQAEQVLIFSAFWPVGS